MSEAQRIEQALDAAVFATFESMLFLEVRLLADKEPVDEPVMRVDLAAETPLKCEISLEASPKTTEMLQEALFADSPPEGDVAYDVLAEILNVVVGNFLIELDDATPVSIGLPMAARDEHANHSLLGIQRVYELEQGPLSVRFCIS